MVIFNKASNTMDEKIRIVSITIYYYFLCSHSVLIKYLLYFFKKQNKTEVCLFEIVSYRC